MICVKFGGTSVTPENLHYVADIVDNNVGPVVVSAVGREFLGDDKLTDLLDRYGKSREEIVWQAICGKMVRLCEVNGIDVDVERLLFNARQQIERHNRDYCLSVGEELTARCVAAFLGREYIEAAEYLVFSDGRFDEKQTKLRVKELAGHRFVVGGFYGGTDSGERATFQYLPYFAIVRCTTIVQTLTVCVQPTRPKSPTYRYCDRFPTRKCNCCRSAGRQSCTPIR